MTAFIVDCSANGVPQERYCLHKFGVFCIRPKGIPFSIFFCADGWSSTMLVYKKWYDDPWGRLDCDEMPKNCGSQALEQFISTHVKFINMDVRENYECISCVTLNELRLNFFAGNTYALLKYASNNHAYYKTSYERMFSVWLWLKDFLVVDLIHVILEVLLDVELIMLDKWVVINKTLTDGNFLQ